VDVASGGEGEEATTPNAAAIGFGTGASGYPLIGNQLDEDTPLIGGTYAAVYSVSLPYNITTHVLDVYIVVARINAFGDPPSTLVDMDAGIWVSNATQPNMFHPTLQRVRFAMATSPAPPPFLHLRETIALSLDFTTDQRLLLVFNTSQPGPTVTLTLSTSASLSYSPT
jgi:hypothetical protein